MGLNHPENIELWRDWERSRRPLRRAKASVVRASATIRDRRGHGDAEAVAADTAPAAPATPVEAAWTRWSRAGERPERILIPLDVTAPTSRASLLTFLPYVRCGVDVVAPADAALAELEGFEATSGSDAEALMEEAEPAAVVTVGHFLELGAAAHAVAQRRGMPEYVIQHGALTPFAPPLPHDATLLAWSEADGDFWTSSRTDVKVRAVGSQLLWQAGHDEPEGEGGAPDPEARPVFLGQLHGAELSRRVTGGAAWGFCRAENALYRPHPAETDVLSRTIHRAMRRAGIEFAPTDVPLAKITAPIVAVFSTGVLEAAARGVPAWVHAPAAPGWVHEFWRRYDMRPFGGEPTPAPAMPEGEPAAAMARIIEGAL